MTAIEQLYHLRRMFPRASELAVSRDLLRGLLTESYHRFRLSECIHWGDVEQVGPLRVTSTMHSFAGVPLVIVEHGEA